MENPVPHFTEYKMDFITKMIELNIKLEHNGNRRYSDRCFTSIFMSFSSSDITMKDNVVEIDTVIKLN